MNVNHPHSQDVQGLECQLSCLLPKTVPAQPGLYLHPLPRLMGVCTAGMRIPILKVAKLRCYIMRLARGRPMNIY